MFTRSAIMKKSYLLLGLAACVTSLSAVADRYEFIAGDASVETQVCIAAVTDDKLALRKSVKQLPAARSVHRTEHFRMKSVANSLKCNGDYIANFASKYNASETYQYLNRYTRPSNRLTPTTTIRDITAKVDNGDDEKVIQILVASR
ncbi:DUF3718 domain-containing protein [Alteromonas salexigens]|uniref:DUF3718 domain-containing protein n=1 Tax=Alteromonas salexigens TaxID=2982530 RepID=UPI0035717845